MNLSALGGALILASSCCKDVRTDFNITSVAVTEVRIKDGNNYVSSLVLRAGDTRQLSAEVLPDDATNKEVSWNSNDASIATITANGLLTAVTGGNATITVTTRDGARMATLDLIVTSLGIAYCQVDAITSLTLLAGEGEDLTTLVLPDTGSAVTWGSSDATVASITSTGNGSARVTALRTGTAVITATSSGNYAQSESFELTVAAAGTTPNIAIKTESDLRLMGCRLNATYTLANDIVLTKEWAPLGDVRTSFAGTLDGAGFTIRNLFINSPQSDSVGLIGNNSGTIRNIGVEVGLQGITARSLVGAIVGYNSGSVSGVVTGQGSVNAITNYGSVGGLVGWNTGTGQVTGYSSVVVNSAGENAGGLVGYNRGNVIGYAEGNVRASAGYAGGLVGLQSLLGTIVGYYVTGVVSGPENVGGMLGGIDNDNAIGYSRGGVAVTSNNRIGQFVGYVNTTNNTLGSIMLSAYYSGKVGESSVTGGTPNGIGTSITVTTATTEADFTGFDFTGNNMNWTFFTGKWPAINFPAGQSIFDNYRGDKQPINP